MEDYKFEILEKIKGIVNKIEEDDLSRITLDLDDSYTNETEITITIELNKDESLLR